MTREEAIEELLMIKRNIKEESKQDKALDMAIKALSAEPCEDCISREQAIEVLRNNYRMKALDEIQRLSSVQPIKSKGEWIDSDISNEKYVCSNCGGACWYYDYEGEVAKSKFCPNCGADMRGTE